MTRTLDSVAQLLDVISQCELDDYELLLIDNGSDLRTAMALRVIEQIDPLVQVHRLADPASTPVARNWGASMANGDVLIFVDSGVELQEADVAQVLETSQRLGRGFVQPLIVRSNGVVRSGGQFLGPLGTGVTWGAGLMPDDGLLPRGLRCDGVEGLMFAVDAVSYRRLQGLDPLFVRGGSDLDIGLRASEIGIPTILEPRARARLRKEWNSDLWAPNAADRGDFARRWHHHTSALLSEALAGRARLDGYAPLGSEPPAFPKRWTPRMTVEGSTRRWAIKTSVPDMEVSESWGDWHFAVALREALSALGEDVVIDTTQSWGRPTTNLDHVNLVLRGTQQYEPNPGQINILWLISHPERVTYYELSRYDRVYVASEPFARGIRRRWNDVDARPLLQCTEPSRFYPDPDPACTHDLLFVGNSRGVLRPVVRDAIDAGLKPSVFGANWDEIIPSEYVVADHIPNRLLRHYYSSAQVVLNDHWHDMKRYGFISNRLFDAVASGAVVVSDSIQGLADLFGDRSSPTPRPKSFHWRSRRLVLSGWIGIKWLPGLLGTTRSRRVPASWSRQRVRSPKVSQEGTHRFAQSRPPDGSAHSGPTTSRHRLFRSKVGRSRQMVKRRRSLLGGRVGAAQQLLEG